MSKKAFEITVKNEMGDVDPNGPVEMLIHEPVGWDPDTFQGLSSNAFGQVLNRIPKGKPVVVGINTMGGSVADGVAIHNMMVARGNVHTRVDGYAASMGAVIFQAGAKRVMMPGTMLVIHNPENTVSGDFRDSAANAEYLKTVKGNLVDLLSARTKVSKKAISDMMDQTTAIDPEQACEMGFCDEVPEGAPAWNSFSTRQVFNFCRRFGSAPSGAAAGRGQPAQPNKNTQMKKLTETLAKLKLVASADLTEDQMASQLETNLGTLTGERDSLKTENQKHKDALKTRVTNRVQKAIDDKRIKAERKEGLITIGLADESALDFLDDIPVPGAQPVAGGRRGAPPVPPEKNGASEAQARIDALRETLRTETDPAAIGRAARELRGLRGHADMFKATAAAAK